MKNPLKRKGWLVQFITCLIAIAICVLFPRIIGLAVGIATGVSYIAGIFDAQADDDTELSREP